MNFAAELLAGYEHALDRPFLVTTDTSSTYREIEQRACSFAGALLDCGVGQGDRVLVKTAKSPDSVALYLACLRLGSVYVPLNPAFTKAEQAFFIEDAAPQVFVNDPADVAPPGLTTLTLGVSGDGSLPQAAATATPYEAIADVAETQIAAMLYTSGTTGRSKGAMLSHRALSANGHALHSAWGFEPGDVLLHPLPVFHTHGLFVALHCALLSGCEVRFLARFDVEETLDALRSCTVMMAVPTIYTRLLADARFDPASCESVRLFTSGSAPMTAAVHEQFSRRTGHRIVERYGMTEAGIITSNPLDGERAPGTVGFALPGYEVRVATTDRPCNVNELGVVEARGPHLFSGYWKLPEKTAEEFRDDGFFVTGDIGSLDKQGRLTLQGRSGDMVICGGENVYPVEIEQCLDASPGVVESAVIGVPHPEFGETVVAYLVVDGDYNVDAVQLCVQESLARFKQPRRYEVVDALPRNAMGKVQKNVLRRLG